ncbi:MAG: HAD-IA family hydrolase [Alphaproteobacteria bacterium]
MDSSPKLIVFDCDGTLVDSQAGIVGAMEAAWRAEGLPPPAHEAIRRVVGLPLTEAIAALAPALDAVPRNRMTEAYKAAFMVARSENTHTEPLFPGIAAALDALEAAGYLLGIATGKGRNGLRLTLERHNLLHRFVTLQTADHGPGKPHPFMLQNAMREAGVDLRDTVMIGDTTFDMVMARRAGTAAVGVAWGYHTPSELRAAGAGEIIHHGAELEAAIARAWTR